jgi:hypothetical protein
VGEKPCTEWYRDKKLYLATELIAKRLILILKKSEAAG